MMKKRKTNPHVTIAAKDVPAFVKRGARIVDVREDHEWETGHIPGALHLPLVQVESKASEILGNKKTTIICYCASGMRSAKAATRLRDLGYPSVHSLENGLSQWNEKLTRPNTSDFSEDEIRRYDKHLKMPEIGLTGQEMLKNTHVVIVGVGGLGCPAAQYLAAAGIGRLTLVDADLVDPGNLQRQILFQPDEIGLSKAELAAKHLGKYNPHITVQARSELLGHDNWKNILGDADIVLDASDNFATRYFLNDACLRLGIPLVHGSIHRFEGQVTVIDGARGPCYRCLYPKMPSAGLINNCAEAGVLGVLPGIIGTLQATEAIKTILKIGSPLVGQLLCYDALSAEFYKIRIPKKPGCLCHNPKAIKPDYGFFPDQQVCSS